MLFRDLSPLVRLSLDDWVVGLQQANPDLVMRRVGEPREEGEAIAVPFEDAASGTRHEVLVWPDGRVGELRSLA